MQTKEIIKVNQLPPLIQEKDRQERPESRRKKKLEKLRQEKHIIIIQSNWRGTITRKKLKEEKRKQLNYNNNEKKEKKEEKEENNNDNNNSIPIDSLISSSKNDNHIDENINLIKKSKSQTQITINNNEYNQRPKSEQILSKNIHLADEKQLQSNYQKDNTHKRSVSESTSPRNIWPVTHHDNFDHLDENLGPWPDLRDLKNNENNLNWILSNKKILLRTITWNMCANKPPPVEKIRQLLLPLDKFHIVVFGTEECERSIAKSAVNPSKKNWESYLVEAMGSNYVPLRSHTLQAIHIMLFVHKSITSLISNITSAAIACGMANTLGNKGGVGLSFQVGSTRIVVINTHLAANQNQTETRNLQFCKICSEIVPLFKKNLNRLNNNDKNENNNDNRDDETSIVEPIPPELIAESNETLGKENEQGVIIQSEPDGDEEEVIGNDAVKQNMNISDEIDEYMKLCNELDRYGDRIIFMGDMNYRINGNRRIVDQLLSLQMHEVLLSNDQLKMSMLAKQIPPYFKEASLNFLPTYKLDTGSNQYDTSSKQRIPSWTDRILFKQSGLKCLVYNSVTDIMISDHRPVYGSFLVNIDVNSELQQSLLTGSKDLKDNNSSNTQFRSESQVCNIM